MTRPSGTPETSSGRKGSKQNSNGKPNNWATNWSPSNPRLHNEPVQRGSSLEAGSLIGTGAVDLAPEKCATKNVSFSQTQEGETQMKGTRHSEEQIITILKQGEAGLATAELCRQHGITEQTYYRWKAKYGGMDSGEAKKLKQLEEENRKLKHVVADLTLDNRALKDVLSKNW